MNIGKNTMKLYELQSPHEVIELEHQLDLLFMPLGLDVKFTRHFIERILHREQSVTQEEVIDSFAKLKKKYKKKILSAKKKDDYEAILKDFSKDLNIIFTVDGDELRNITIHRKDPTSFRKNKKGGDEFKV